MEPYIFDLDNPLEDLSKVPSDLQGLFSQTDGGFIVSDEHKPLATRLNGLANNLTTERSKRTQAGKDAGAARELANAFKSIFEGVEGIDDLTPDNAKTFFQELQTRAAKGGKAGEEAKNQIEAIKQQMSSAHAKELGGLQEQLSAKDKQIEQLVVGSQVTDAIAKHEVIGGEVFRSFLEKRIKVQVGEDGVPKAVVVGEDGTTPVYNGAGDPMGVDEYVGALKAKDEYAPFFKSAKRSGDNTDPNQRRHQQQQNNQDGLTPAQKISAGLSKMKRARGY